MEQFTILLFLYADACMIAVFYAYIFRVKKLIGFQLGMNISIVMGGMAALLFGVLLILSFPFHFTLMTIISALSGGAIGALFGLLFDYQTFVTGFVNGMIIGLMSPMIGTVLEGSFMFVLFVHIFFVLSLFTTVISIKRA